MSIHSLGEEAGAAEDIAQEQYEYDINLLLLDLEKLLAGNVGPLFHGLATNHKSPEVAHYLVGELRQAGLVSDEWVEINLHHLLAYPYPDTLLAVMRLLRGVGLFRTPSSQDIFLSVMVYPSLTHLHQMLLILESAHLLSGEMAQANFNVLMEPILVTSLKNITTLLTALKRNTSLFDEDMSQQHYTLLMEHPLIELLILPLYQLSILGLLTQDNFNMLLSFENEDTLWMVKTTINTLYELDFLGGTLLSQGSDVAGSALASVTLASRRAKQAAPYTQFCLDFIFAHSNPVILEALTNGITTLKNYGLLDGEMAEHNIRAFFSPAIENLSEGLLQLKRCNLLTGPKGLHNVTQLIKYAPILLSTKLWLQVPSYAFTQTAFERLTRFCQEHEMDNDGGEAAFADYVYKHCRPTMGSYVISQNPNGFYGTTAVVNPSMPESGSNLQP